MLSGNTLWPLASDSEYWSAALLGAALRSGAPRGRSAGRSATPIFKPERDSERNSEKARSASLSARSDFCANQKLFSTLIKKKNFARKRA